MRGVSFFNCSAVFGGGAFILASNVSLTNVAAAWNTARAGGGFMLFCNASFIDTGTFSENTVVTNTTSSLAISSLNIVNLTSASDLSAACGGALWALSLTSMRACSFSANSALAVSSEVSYDNATATFFSPHALGSSVFVYGTPPDAVVRNNTFSGSSSACTGWCFAAGAVTIASTLGVNITNNSFTNCTASATADGRVPPPAGTSCFAANCSPKGPSFAVGAALAVFSADGTLSLQNIAFASCIVNATGWSLGGALIIGINAISNGFSAVGLSLQHTRAICTTFPCYAFGGGVYAFKIPSANMSSLYMSDVGAIAFVRNSQAAGGGLFLLGADELFDLKSSTLLSTFVRVFGSQSYAVGGAIAMPGNGVIPTQVHDCIISNSSALAVGIETASLGGGIFNYAKFDMNNTTMVACSSVCEGPRCFAVGGAYTALNNRASLDIASMTLLQAHASRFAFNTVSCNGTSLSRCTAQGGAIFFATTSTNLLKITTFVRASISNCSFISNRATCSRAVGSVSNGGGISCNACGGRVRDSVFHNNSVDSFVSDKDVDVTVEISGGGLYASLHSLAIPGLVVSNTSFLKNSARFHDFGLSGSGGGATVGLMAVVSFADCDFIGNAAHNGGGVAIETQGNVNITNCLLQNNYLHSISQDAQRAATGSSFYSSRGSAIFSANPTATKGGSSVQSQVTLALVHSTIIADKTTSAINSIGVTGSIVYLVGVSNLFVANTSVHMRGAVSGVEISGVESSDAFSSELHTSCDLGYMLQQRSSASSIVTISNEPSLSVQFPPVPVSVFTVLSSLTASCSPCLANTYSFQNSATAISNTSSCTRCPFGAECNGTWVAALPGFWGWTQSPISANTLAQEFVLLPDGYACGSATLCLTFDQCVESRRGVLCGECAEGFTRSIFSKACVPSSSCSTGTTAAWTMFAISMVFAYAAIIVFSGQSSSAGVFQTLMWFYQIAGLLLSGSNSLDRIPGAASLSSIISMIFSASPRPPSGGGFMNISGVCLAADMTQVDVLMVGVVCHAVLLVFVLFLSLNRVFLRCERTIRALKRTLSSCFQWLVKSMCQCLRDDAEANVAEVQYEVSMLDRNGGGDDDAALNQHVVEQGGQTASQVTLNASPDESISSLPPSARNFFSFHHSIGRSVIMLLLTVFVSAMTALVQHTACLAVPGYPFPPGQSENRWYYDGSQECQGPRFTIASIVLIPLSCFPVFLFYRMRKLIILDSSGEAGAVTPVQASALNYCMQSPFALTSNSSLFSCSNLFRSHRVLQPLQSLDGD